MIKRYNYNQNLCYDCSTIEGESELSTIITHYTGALPKNLYISVLYSPFFVPLHWCHDVRPCSGTALHTEWIQCSTNPYKDCPVEFQAIRQKVNRTTKHHALHHSCLVSESTILYYYNAHVTSPQP